MRADLTSSRAKGHAVIPGGSCANLTVGIYSDELRHRYGKCRIGDSVARLAHLKTQIVESDSYVNAHADLDDVNLTPPPIMPPR